jgi:hypothetical protein
MPRMVRMGALDGYRTHAGTLEFGERVVLAISGGVAPACGVVRDRTDR